MSYKFKYKRTPTDARMRVEMPDGSLWDVPIQIIADSRDANYADDQEDTVGFVRRGSLDKGEISDWAANNMNWSDVAGVAVKVDAPAKAVDFEEGWANGEKKIVGLI